MWLFSYECERVVPAAVLCFMAAAAFVHFVIFGIESLCWKFIILAGKDYETFQVFGKSLSSWKEVLKSLSVLLSVISFLFVLVLGILFVGRLCSIKTYIMGTVLFYFLQAAVVYFLVVFLAPRGMAGGIDILFQISWRPIRWLCSLLFGIVGFFRTKDYKFDKRNKKSIALHKTPLCIMIVFSFIEMAVAVLMFIMYNAVIITFYMQMALAVLGVLFVIVYGVYYIKNLFPLTEFLAAMICFFMSHVWLTWLLQIVFDLKLKTFALDRLLYTPFYYVRLGLIVVFIFWGFIFKNIKKVPK